MIAFAAAKGAVSLQPVIFFLQDREVAAKTAFREPVSLRQRELFSSGKGHTFELSLAAQLQCNLEHICVRNL